MNIGATNDVAKLEHILLPSPESYIRKPGDLYWLRSLTTMLEDVLRAERVHVSYLYFSPSNNETENIKDENTIRIKCKCGYLSIFLRDLGIFTRELFISSARIKNHGYGNIKEKFAEKIKTYGIKVEYSNIEGGSFISNGKVCFISVNTDLKKYPKLFEECEEIYNIPELNLHIDNFVNFLNENNFLINFDLLINLAGKLEYYNCDLKAIIKVKEILEKKGYNSIEIHNDYFEEDVYIVANVLTLGNSKIIIMDPKERISKRIEREGIDVINLYERKSFTVLSYLTGGLRCLTLPIKRI